MNITNVLNINWGMVDPKFNYAAMCSLRTVWLFIECPEIIHLKDTIGFWYKPGSIYTLHGELILKEQVDWAQTLTERPLKHLGVLS